MDAFGGGYSFTVGNDIFIGSGEQLYSYNTGSGTWSARPDFIGAGTDRKWATAFAIGNKGYVGLGITQGNVFHSDLYVYDTVLNNWSPVAPMPATPRGGASAFVIDGKAYVCGGTSTGGTFSQVYRYDPQSNTWSQVSTLPTGNRGFTAAFSIGQYGYVYGGYTGFGNETNQLHRFDPVTNTWTQQANLPGGGRQASFGASVNGQGIIGFGQAGFSSFFADIYAFNPLTNSWSAAIPFPGGARYETVSGVVNDVLYTGAGTAAGFEPRNDWWKWESTVGIQEQSDTNDLLVLYPSPTTDILTVRSTSVRSGSIAVNDLHGRQVTSATVQSGTATISVIDLPAGVYTLTLQTTDGVPLTRRFIRSTP